MSSTGERIKKLRTAKGLTQDSLAQPLGIGRSNFGHIEKGRVTPSSKQIDTIADILNTTADYLLCRTENPSSPGNQMYIGFDGIMKTSTVSETVAMYKTMDINAKTRALKEQLIIAENNDDLDSSDKSTITQAIYLSIELLEKYGSVPPSHVPLVGNICAGDGLFAQDNIEEYVSYPIVTKSADFALRVRGNSMINAGIDDGDIVFFKQKNWFDYNGQIVAVITEDNNGTLKRIKWSESSSKFQLIPENEEYEIIELTPSEFRICGVIAGVFKPDVN